MKPFGILPGLRTKMLATSGLPERTFPSVARNGPPPRDDPFRQDPPEGLQGGPDGRLGPECPDRGGREDCLCGMEKVPSTRERLDPLLERFLGREDKAK